MLEMVDIKQGDCNGLFITPGSLDSNLDAVVE